MIGVSYPDHYAVEEVFQLLKVPWEYVIPGRQYDVVIACKADVPDYSGNLIDLTENDIFEKISDLLNNGESHQQEPVCDLAIDTLRQELKKYTILVEIPPVPWGYQYLVALTHDVDVTSIKECRVPTVGNAIYRCIKQGNFRSGLYLFCSRCGIGNDPWLLFNRWKAFEEQLGVRSTFFFVPWKDDQGMRAHPYRAVAYDIKMDILRDLESGGWEAGVHGIDNWIDVERGKHEMAALGLKGKEIGNRTHWLLFDKNSWKALDEAGYLYDSTFGYNDDVGFRAGTLQVYRPRHVQTLLELPLHIQDVGLLGKFCWAPNADDWVKTPCLYLDAAAAQEYSIRIFNFAKKYGGVVTVLWHYENLTPPRDWSGMYETLVRHAQADGAWVTTAGRVVKWFKTRRGTGIGYSKNKNILSVTCRNLDFSQNPPQRVRVHVDPARVSHIDNEYRIGEGYVDILCNKQEITVTLT